MNPFGRKIHHERLRVEKVNGSDRNLAQRAPALLKALNLYELKRAKGYTSAPIVWLYLCSHLQWGGRQRVVWPCNRTIAEATGLSLRSVSDALALLTAMNRISTHQGFAPGWKRKGRIITLKFDAPLNPVVRWPDKGWMDAAWRRCRTVRQRPAQLMAIALTAYIRAAVGDVPSENDVCPLRIKDLRGMVGASHGGTFNKRLADLERCGLFKRLGAQWRHGFELCIKVLLMEIQTLLAEMKSAPPRVLVPPEPPRLVANGPEPPF